MNGYSFGGAYDAENMSHGDEGNGGNMMMMGQDGISGGAFGGQSLDEIVNQNAKAIRRQSLPHQYGGSQHAMDPALRRISMMEFAGSASPSGQLGNFQFDSSTTMDQTGIISGNGTPGSGSHSRTPGHRRPSHGELAIDTAFANSQTYTNIASNPPYQSPAHPQSGFDVAMESPYLDTSLGMQMDYSVDQSLASASAGDMSQLNMYGQAQFNPGMMASPMHHSASRGDPHSARGSVRESGMNTQYSGHTNSSDTATHHSRRHSIPPAENTSPMQPTQPAGATPLNQPGSGPSPNYGPSGFQPQHPHAQLVEPQQDRGMGNAAQIFDGVNGPLPLGASNFNPNNQGFNWDAPKDGWPSTMVGRPHMQTTYKNVYSSTGFDMLSVLVRVIRLAVFF